MPADWKDGDELPPGIAKKLNDEMLADPRHQRVKGSRDDELTRDDPLDEGDNE